MNAIAQGRLSEMKTQEEIDQIVNGIFFIIGVIFLFLLANGAYSLGSKAYSAIFAPTKYECVTQGRHTTCEEIK